MRNYQLSEAAPNPDVRAGGIKLLLLVTEPDQAISEVNDVLRMMDFAPMARIGKFATHRGSTVREFELKAVPLSPEHDQLLTMLGQLLSITENIVLYGKPATPEDRKAWRVISATVADLRAV